MSSQLCKNRHDQLLSIMKNKFKTELVVCLLSVSEQSYQAPIPLIKLPYKNPITVKSLSIVKL